MVSLVIGYGNDLRSDDGAGRVVADRLDALALPDVTVRSVIQLTPELALEIAKFDTVVFVDASVEVAETISTPVVAGPKDPTALSHYNTPETILGMTATVGRVPSTAVSVSIPVTDIGLGMELTPMTAAGVEEAIAIVTAIVTE